MKLLVIPGTVRENRWSIHPARYVTELCNEQEGVDAELFDMAEYDIPLLRNRRYTDGDTHPDVETFGQKVDDADGIVIVTPEYNHSYPGALKNLLDHLYPEYEGMPFSSITVSRGHFGGVRCQENLVQLVVTLKAHPGPHLAVARARDAFTEDGELLDEDYETRFEEFVEKAVAHTLRFST